ncbi:MAG: TraR/DksA C4-type zinc finger protein [Anaerolineae bacterium]
MDNVATREQSDITRLETERQEILVKLEHLHDDLRSLAEPSADEADVDAYEREKIWALIQSLQRKLESTDRAIDAAQKGTYGICENCGQRIDPARLEILPQATLCLKCQREFERQNRRLRP